MAKVYGHRKCRSSVEVVTAEAFDRHAHGIITKDGKVRGVQAVTLLVTDADGNIVAATSIDANLTVNGTLTADKVVGAVYM